MPNYPIPEPYCWDESFRTFYESIDEEHKGLFQGIFACAGDRGNKGKLDSLAALVGTHFKNEEAIMQSKNYANFKSHKGIHDKFIADLGKLSVPLSDGDIDFAKKWLVDHIKDIDFQYKGKLD